MVKSCYVDLDCDIKTEEKLLSYAASEAYKAGLVLHEKNFLNGLIEREKEITTAIGRNVAFPHAKGDFIKYPFVYFIRTKTQIDFKAIDKKGVNLFFVIGTPLNNENNHLRVLSKLANLLSNKKDKDMLIKENQAIKIRDFLIKTFKPNVLILGANYTNENKLKEFYKDKINLKFIENENKLDLFDMHINDFCYSFSNTKNEKIKPVKDLVELADELEKII